MGRGISRSAKINISISVEASTCISNKINHPRSYVERVIKKKLAELQHELMDSADWNQKVEIHLKNEIINHEK